MVTVLVASHVRQIVAVRQK